ncbi:mannose-1-phosphate guanylyltransferase [Roseiconus lacunae]|uniref:Mannose-1-phosphate guanylyltransferase n=1 Tax=Roseiconus lacunae TaxID=2605694 RepID=A0ABT7PI74_9BACT|nr:mannose-1-phosphate guanylyltransferase [Roseiconus lacunae]MCD0461363.1 mannose-1-phosphate guanylyltransferase [Roseiconus lacunae]MDM4016190.1 mannose-1-phosphate guanylyltransferase [Roseiconus lacunae]WRQ51475.1 mannose-1-phosphate guanylyltransferase [Stieleria sp. HD01]
MLYAVIMAGGSGTRFWPASRKLRPKQLLALSSGSNTMIQATSERLGGLVPVDRQLILTNEVLIDPIGEQLPGLPKSNLIGEPAKRDTAPCIGLAASLIAARDPEAIMAVMPSDHVIGTDEQFCADLKAAERLVEEDPTRIVTFGIKPTYPAESFGYIQRGAKLGEGLENAFDVEKFREKPDRETAEQYVQSGDFYWNSGIFLWKASTILKALEANQPEMFDHIKVISEAIGSPDYDAVLDREFKAIKGTSIDYAVMENYDNVAVIEAGFTWDDVGSWQSLGRLHSADDRGNTSVGDHVSIDTSGSIVFGESDHTIVTIGIEDLIVVHTKDATLVAPKSAEERVREAVKLLEETGRVDRL